MASERNNISGQTEHLQMKYTGTGHAEIKKQLRQSHSSLPQFPSNFIIEWLVNQHRDSCASYLGHSSLTSYFAVAENQSLGRTRYNLMQKMIQPCGPAPKPM